LRRLCAVLGLAVSAACSHVEVSAPNARSVRVMAADDPAAVRREYRAWFAIWGLVRVSGKDPADVIRDENLCAARVRIEDNVPDAGISVVYTVIEPVGLIAQTIIVEGIRNCE